MELLLIFNFGQTPYEKIHEKNNFATRWTNWCIKQCNDYNIPSVPTVVG